MAQQKKRNENIPEITWKMTLEPKTWTRVLISPILPPPLCVSPSERRGLGMKSSSCAKWILWEFHVFFPFIFPKAVDLAAQKSWEWREAGQDKIAWKEPSLSLCGLQRETKSS